MSHVKLDIFIHGNITGLNTAMMKSPMDINASIPVLMRPTLMHYKLRFLHVANTCPDDRQSSRMSITATATSYIQVTQILKLHMETSSPYEGHTSCPSFSRLLHCTSGLPHDTSGLPKILHRLHLTLLTMLGLWGSPYE